ncbi:MAG TPA: hypothetical protein VIS99_05275, partial [Terrimicrobiaceae bacterium]
MNNESFLPSACPLGQGPSLTFKRAILLVPVMLLAVATTGWPVVLYDNGTFTTSGNAFSDPSFPAQAGDDFTLSMAGTAQQIQWWGVYFGSPAPVQDNFTIGFFSFTGSVPDVNPLASYAIGNNLTRTDTGQDTLGGLDIFQYSATIPDTALAAGTPYLLSIVNDTTPNWGWTFSPVNAGRWFRSSDQGSWGSFDNTPGLAFNISGTVAPPTVPEGGTSALLLGVA